MARIRSLGRRRSKRRRGRRRAGAARRTWFDQAYERLENLLIVCELRPGSVTSIQDLQELSGFGRAPVHQAVNRLAADTLLSVQARQGIRIAPIEPDAGADVAAPPP